MKRQLLKLLSLATIATCGMVSADICNPCCADPCGNIDNCCNSSWQNFDVWGEALYFQPSSCNFNYCVRDRINCVRTDGFDSCDDCFNCCPQGTEKGVNPKYHWGWRVGVDYNGCCGDARVSYSRLKTSDHCRTRVFCPEFFWITSVPSCITDDALFSFDGDPAGASCHVKTEWNAVDGEVGSVIRQGCNCNLLVRGHIGLHWTEITVNFKNHYFGYPCCNSDSFEFLESHTHTKTWGIGPRFGSDFTYDLGCGLGIVASANWGILVGEIRHRTSAFYSTDDCSDFCNFSIRNKERCVVFPEFDASLGAKYDVCLCNRWNFGFEIGWEFRTYLQSIVHSYYLDVDAYANSATVCDPFSLQGLYIKGELKF